LEMINRKEVKFPIRKVMKNFPCNEITTAIV
jgi:hypothetical protein